MFIFCYCRRFGEVADSVTLIEDQDEVIDLEEDHDLSSSDEDEDEDIAEETVSTGLLNCTVLLNQETFMTYSCPSTTAAQHILWHCVPRQQKKRPEPCQYIRVCQLKSSSCGGSRRKVKNLLVSNILHNLLTVLSMSVYSKISSIRQETC